MNWPVNHFYCTNLKGNDERWEKALIEFERVGLSVERVESIFHENKFLSFNHTHLEIVKKGLETGEPFAAFEDDVLFDKNYFRIEESFSQLPEGWDMLYLGCNFIGIDTMPLPMPLPFSQHLCQLVGAWQSHAMIYSNKCAKWIIENFDPNAFPVYDEWLRLNVQSKENTFLMRPMIAYQRPNFSDIWDRDVDYTGCHFIGNKMLEEL